MRVPSSLFTRLRLVAALAAIALALPAARGANAGPDPALGLDQDATAIGADLYIIGPGVFTRVGVTEDSVKQIGCHYIVTSPEQMTSLLDLFRNAGMRAVAPHAPRLNLRGLADLRLADGSTRRIVFEDDMHDSSGKLPVRGATSRSDDGSQRSFLASAALPDEARAWARTAGTLAEPDPQRQRDCLRSQAHF